MSVQPTADESLQGVVAQQVEEATEELREELDELREENERLHEELAEERKRRAELEAELEDVELRFEAQLDDIEKRLDANARWKETMRDTVDEIHSTIGELQSRELEKGAHLRDDNVVEPAHLDVAGDRIETITKENGQQYARLPGEDDPLGRGGSTVLAHGDLLPIQQLARLDEDMLATEARPVQLAVKAWQIREETGNYGLWNTGANGVDRYMDSSDLASEIRAWETGIGSEYAQKLAQRAMDALQELTKHRVRIERRTHRKDRLQYKERRLILPTEADIPGDTPETAGVGGE